MLGRRFESEGRSAPGGEDHHVAATGDLSGHRDRIVSGAVHVDKAALGHPFAVANNLIQRRRTRLGGRAQRLLVDIGQAAELVSGSWVVVDAATEVGGVVLPPMDAVDQFLADFRRFRPASEQMLGAINLGGFAEHHRATLLDDDVRRLAETRIGGYA